MCYRKIFPVLFRAVLLGKFQDLVGAHPYQTQLGQHSAVNIVELCSYIYSSGIGPTSYPGHFAYKLERE